MTKISFLGTGTWGFCLAWLLSTKGYQTISWTRNSQLAKQLTKDRKHPFLPEISAPESMHFTSNLKDALSGVDLLVESVTASGLRSVFEEVKKTHIPSCPIVITSKGIERKSNFILPEVLMEVLGKQTRSQIACLSGPSYAEEVIRGLPTSVVISAFDPHTMKKVCDFFQTPSFRVYPNSDIKGVAYGGALKNIIAIACGIAEGLGMGYSTKAAIMTRGLHEIRKLAVNQGCQPETLSGLSGMGDLCLTCGSLISRNCRFGYFIAQGMSPTQAQEKIGMVVEGVYTCEAVHQLSKQLHIPMPITEMVYKIIYEEMPIKKAVKMLMERSIKPEHL